MTSGENGLLSGKLFFDWFGFGIPTRADTIHVFCFYILSQLAGQNHRLHQTRPHKFFNISSYVIMLTPQFYHFLRHHRPASHINLFRRAWFCIRSSISWCRATDQPSTNSLHIAFRRTDCIAVCRTDCIVTIDPRWQMRSVQMTAWQESSICSNHHLALNYQIGYQLYLLPNYQMDN